jgi:hypothetical protein
MTISHADSLFAQRSPTVIPMITFASCYVYSPTGLGAVCERSRLLRALLKAGDASFMRKYACRVRQLTGDATQLAGFFGAADVLVPVPGSTPYIAGRLWAAEHLTDELLHAGLGGSAWCGLRRVRPVRKSATAAPGSRPTVSVHYESFVLEHPTGVPERILLIDDVVTTGRTLLAAASRVHETFPNSQIRAFALLRTMGLISGVQQLLDPCKGAIRWQAGDARRSP